MNSNQAVKFLPIVSEEKKIDVSLENGQAVIKLSTWTEDLGWLCQKTLSLDEEMLEDLHRVIASARYKLNSSKDEGRQTASKILEFPNIS